MVRKTGKQKCYFCLNNQDPDYKDYSVLARFLNARGGIVGRKKTGPANVESGNKKSAPLSSLTVFVPTRIKIHGRC